MKTKKRKKGKKLNKYQGFHQILDPSGAHSAYFNEKVHKPQSKSYGRIGANMQLIFTHIL